MRDIGKESIALHRTLRGKITVESKRAIRSRADLSLYYTPGVGSVASYIAKHKGETDALTWRGNTVAVVTDGSAVLGLGNLGPEGALPVMEGKAMIFQEFAGINGVPIVLATQDVDEIVAAVKAIAPSFGGINLEDIGAPRCFEIEERLKRELNIPVMHDDQHGTAIVILAGLINAVKVVGKSLKEISVVIVGAGAAGTALANLLRLVGVSDMRVLDTKGLIVRGRRDLAPHKKRLASFTNKKHIRGGLDEAMASADAIVGVSGPDTIRAAHIKRMARDPIVFALANPIPEIRPEEARRGGAAVIATGRSDFPNQVNNALVYPGIFRGALDKGVRKITDDIKVRVARSLAALIKRPMPECIIPNVFDRRVVPTIARAVR